MIKKNDLGSHLCENRYELYTILRISNTYTTFYK